MDGDGLPSQLSGPAVRALQSAGIRTVPDLAGWQEMDLLDLHGVSPRVVAVLRAALAREGLGLRTQDDDDPGVVAVTGHLATLPSSQRATLTAMRTTLRRLLPHAEEGMAYGMPALRLHGTAVAGYDATRDHCIYAPMSGQVLQTLADHLTGYTVSKGTLRLPVEGRLPTPLMRRLVAARLAEVSAVDDGWRREYTPDGRVKAEGQMRQGQLHGPWTWYRNDGSLMRTGSFADGSTTGKWTTWPR